MNKSILVSTCTPKRFNRYCTCCYGGRLIMPAGEKCSECDGMGLVTHDYQSILSLKQCEQLWAH